MARLANYNKAVSIEISAYEQYDNRLERLARVVLYVLNHKRSTDTTPLKSLHDHKGCLIVSYSSAPSDELKELIEDAWEDQGEREVEHGRPRR